MEALIAKIDCVEIKKYITARHCYFNNNVMIIQPKFGVVTFDFTSFNASRCIVKISRRSGNGLLLASSGAFQQEAQIISNQPEDKSFNLLDGRLRIHRMARSMGEICIHEISLYAEREEVNWNEVLKSVEEYSCLRVLDGNLIASDGSFIRSSNLSTVTTEPDGMFVQEHGKVTFKGSCVVKKISLSTGAVSLREAFSAPAHINAPRNFDPEPLVQSQETPRINPAKILANVTAVGSFQNPYVTTKKTYGQTKVGIAVSAHIYDKHSLNLLANCIRSIVDNKSIISKIVIIDDHSTFKSVFEYYDRLSGVEVIRHTQNKGIACTKNESLKALADCDIMMLSDHDNEFHRGFDTYYVDNLIKYNCHSVWLSNIFNDDNPRSVDKEFCSYRRFGGAFIVVDKYIVDNVGGFPILPTKYGAEHYNYQVRINKFLGRPNAAYDFVAGNKFIRNTHLPNSFTNPAEKERLAIINGNESDRILSTGVVFMPIKSSNDSIPISIVIPHRKSTEDRETNINSVIKYYAELLPDCEVIVVEQDVQPRFKRDGVRSIFTYSNKSFNKSWAVNVGVNNALHKVVMCIDSDIIIDKEAIMEAFDLIDRDVIDVCNPYSQFLDLNPPQTENFNKNRILETNPGRLIHRYNPTYTKQYGGVVIVNKAVFRKYGGFNQNFVGWGGEDEEFIIRMDNLCRFKKFDKFNIYHLYHSRIVDATPQHVGYSANLKLRYAVDTMSKEDFENYYKTLLPDFANEDLYKGE